MTPEQMRALADRRLAAQNDWALNRGWQEDAEAALRAAADQLEAVQKAWRIHQGAERDMLNGRPAFDALDEQSEARAALDAILAADTAPKEDRDE